jgi:hypothetical protein
MLLREDVMIALQLVSSHRKSLLADSCSPIISAVTAKNLKNRLALVLCTLSGDPVTDRPANFFQTSSSLLSNS